MDHIVRWECPKCGENNKGKRNPFQVGCDDAKKGVDRNPHAAGTIAWTRYRNGFYSAGLTPAHQKLVDAATAVEWMQPDLLSTNGGVR